MGLAENQFIFSCAKASLVREVQVCFNLAKSGMTIKNCTKSTSTCTKGGENIELMGWAIKPQQRVFDYPQFTLQV